MSSVASQIARHSVIYAAGDLLGKSISFLLIPLYTSYLKPEDYGTLEILTLVSYVANFLITLGIVQSVTRYYFEYHTEAERLTVVSTALILLTSLAAGAVVLLEVIAPYLSSWLFGSGDHRLELMIVFATLGISVVCEVPFILLRLEERSITYAALSMVRVLLGVVLNVYFIACRGLGVYGFLYSSLIATAVTTGLVLTITLPRLPGRFSKQIVRSLLSYGLPLIGCWAGMYIMNFADRFILRRYCGLSEVGVYSLAYKFGMLPNMLIQAPFFLIWGTRQFQVALEPNAGHVFGRMFSYYLLFQITVWVGISLVIPDLLVLMTRGGYADAARYVSPLVLSYVFYGIYSFVQFGLMKERRTGVLSAAVMSIAVLNIVLNLLLIPSMKAQGATIATVISFVVLAVLVEHLGAGYFAISFEWRRIAILSAGAVLFLVVSQLVPGSIPTPYRLTIRSLIALGFPVYAVFSGFLGAEEREELFKKIHGLTGPNKFIKST